MEPSTITRRSDLAAIDAELEELRLAKRRARGCERTICFAFIDRALDFRLDLMAQR